MPEPVQYDARWRWSEAARDLICMKAGTSAMWEQDAGKEANAQARKVCVLKCPFRVDCYMTSYLLGDVGVIRGGVMMVGKVKMHNCQRCGLPAIRANRRRLRSLCSVCVCLWKCYGCGRRFYVERQNEPRSPRQYHNEVCRIASLRDRINAVRSTNLVAA